MRRDLPIVVLIVFAVGVGCNLFSPSESGEIVFDRTEVGTPVGDKVSKEIGPAGGVLASADGRVTVTVPANAVSEKISFSIQPISNMARNGIGNGYRLEPNGKTFPVPLEIAARYDEHDLAGTAAEALAVAYQDTDGAWHAIPPLSLTENRLTIATTHFTDFSILATLKLSPATATVRVGETISIELVGCLPRPASWWDKLSEPIFDSEKKREEIKRERSRECYLGGKLSFFSLGWYTDYGTLGPSGNPISYTAPAQKPEPNVATVGLPYSASATDFSNEQRRGLLLSRITIVDRGYRADGSFGPNRFSGVICDLSKPFTVDTSNPFMPKFSFTPSSANTGKWYYPYVGVSGSGGGAYVVEGPPEQRTAITISGSGTVTAPVSGTGAGTVRITLTPLAANEGWCSE